MYKYMLVRMDNIPTEMTVDKKILTGPKEVLEEYSKILNETEESNNGYFYTVMGTEEKLYDGKVMNYGHGDLPEEVFEKEKWILKMGNDQYSSNLNKQEIERLGIDINLTPYKEEIKE